MAKFQFYPTDLSYKVIRDRAAIYMYGRTTDGKQICIVDEDFEPYCYVVPKTTADMNTLKQRIKEVRDDKKETFEVIKTETVTKIFGVKERTAIKVVTNLPKAIPTLKDQFRDLPDVESVVEADILYTRRYLIDKKIVPLLLTDVEAEALSNRTEKTRVPIFKATSIQQTSNDTLSDLRILGFDIETYNPAGKVSDPERFPIVMIALYGASKGETFSKVITSKRFKTDHDYVEFVEGEAELIERFKELVAEYGPDILTGYYSDGFDFPYILKRASKYKIKIDINLDYEHPVSTRGKLSGVETTGIIHLDILSFIRRILSRKMKTDSFTLDNVAEELLGEKKDDVDIEKLAEYWDEASDKLSDFAKYNLKDAKLTFDLCEKVLPNIIELVKLVGQTIKDTSKMPFSQLVEWYLMRRSSDFNQFIPNKPGHKTLTERMHKRVQGAFVFEPVPGIYDNVVVFDFRSLYPSIIVSHNISIETLNCDCCTDTERVPIEGYDLRFCKKREGFFSSVLEDVIKRRMRVKEIMKNADPAKKVFLDARQESLKVLSNSFYGYLGFFGARWYAKDCARSVTAYGRHYIHKVIDTAEAQGLRVLYSDTDSVFLHLGDKPEKEALKFADNINAELPGLMELEFEGRFPRALFVAIKDSELGAKKKYAMIDDNNNMTIKGFETVRRNVSNIAKDTQKEVIRILLKENNKEKAVNFVKDVIQRLKDKKIPTDQVIITTRLSKPIEQYDAIGPHVAAAKRLEKRGNEIYAGMKIEYVIVTGKEKIRDRAKLPDEVKDGQYDVDYYLNNQVLPALEQILDVFDEDIHEIAEGKEQSKLGSFF